MNYISSGHTEIQQWYMYYIFHLTHYRHVFASPTAGGAVLRAVMHLLVVLPHIRAA